MGEGPNHGGSRIVRASPPNLASSSSVEEHTAPARPVSTEPQPPGREPVSDEPQDFTAHLAQAGETAPPEEVEPAEDDDSTDSDDDVEAHGSWGGIG
jgi:hypothetical protein